MAMGENRCLMLCIFVLISQLVSAQDNLFYQDASIKRGYAKYEDKVFVCDTLDNAMICIYNSRNEYWGKEQCFTDDTQWTEAMLLGKVKFVNTTAGQGRHIMSIVDKAFSEEMAAQLNGTMFMVTVHINSSDGTVAGVGFTFDKGDEYEDIPIGVYKQIEDEIKNNLAFELTPLAQKLNFNQLSWLQCPEGRAEVNKTEDDAASGSGNNGSVQTDIGGVITDRGTVGGDVGGGISGRGNNPLTPTIGGRVTP